MNDKTMVWVTFFKEREMRKIVSPFFVSLFIIFIRLSKEDIIYVTIDFETPWKLSILPDLQFI